MSTKKELLEILEQNRNTYVSGQELADRLKVSRAAIWKAIRRLEDEGHRISGINNKGYRLESGSDILTPEGISCHLDPKWQGLPVLVYKSVDSTNNEAKRLPEDQRQAPLVLVANEQTKGKGRMGRNFHSPADTGIYLTLVLKPRRHISDLATITTKASVAVCRVLDSLIDEKAAIKWVNDIYLGGRKVGGILTEAVTDFESGMVETLIIGIGLNIRTREQDFPQEISSLAGSIHPENITRNEIVARLVGEMLRLYEDRAEGEIMEEYRSRCFILNREIRYTIRGEAREGRALDVNEEGHLIVEEKDGGRVVLNSGEVSLRSGRAD